MQKDIHFYLTYALARRVGICAETSELIAWSNYHTDQMTRAGLYGIQTQSAILGNWKYRQIQTSVLIPFHFLPGNDGWDVEPNSARAQSLIVKAKSPIELGIALHALQDSYSHQGFSGWQESSNSCYPWWYIQSLAPNIGHAEMGVVPDVVNYVWTDPRTGEVIDNKVRAESCAASTFRCLFEFADRPDVKWTVIADELEPIFHLKYDDRKRELRRLGGNRTISYKNLDFDEDDFIQAARKHLAAVMESLNLIRK